MAVVRSEQEKSRIAGLFQQKDGRTPIRRAAKKDKKLIVFYLLDIIETAIKEGKLENKNDCLQLGWVVMRCLDHCCAEKSDPFYANPTYTINELRACIKRLYACGANDIKKFYDTKENSLHIVSRQDVRFLEVFRFLLTNASVEKVNELDTTGPGLSHINRILFKQR